MLSDSEYLRYSRQIMLPEVGECGQQALKKAHVLMVGAGGLGTTAGLYLAGAGVGQLAIADSDHIELSNLARQVAYREAQIGTGKAAALAANLGALNPHCQCRAINAYLEDERLALEVAMADVVLDCSDNLATRHAVNQVCVETGTPLVSAAAIGWQGQLLVYQPHSACYACAFADVTPSEPTRCAEAGVMGPVVGMMATAQALEGIKLLLGQAVGTNRLSRLDGQTMTWQHFSLPVHPHCAVCQPTREVSDAVNH
ncbi:MULTISPECIES: HesA/MoeB/ThiF family protein [Salinivibrio]|uniref:Molybdopterin-synthase adenylyltransferase MoeB n=1 Tax=Salinivibrio costicola subsp. alcaliphilus TaxID=272773 RepID=A0ABX3KPR4_SALCS|nr:MULTISPECIES: HesA/MoeB/ThiF family protein [Salinivibrio]NUY55445.1 HesA/MoeB/ThiF family protein [Salinivibrio sp. EAGSL]OOF33607.1 molybdopterin-synthase adenylyltransferase MoeB [Salinivibrio costicola subsp. alcaliphilus]